MKTNIFAFSLLLLFTLNVQAAPLFLGLSGQAKCADQDSFLADIDHVFTEPLAKVEPHIKTFYSFQSDADCEFTLGLIAEPKDAQGKLLLADYVKRLEKGTFYGFRIQFIKVLRIEEVVSLSAGLYNPARGDVDLSSQTEKSFVLKSVLKWENFTNGIGQAFQSHRPEDFQKYLNQFFGDKDYLKFAQDVLAHNDVVIAHLNPKLHLANSMVIDEDSGISPFIDMPFQRNCWAPDYEHGMCKASP